ncbi:MAG TPA: alpha/beta hydrolase [Mycobacteriales bacterium]|nr:alpha/beta hydrolase [Mycobacteriales bacterium]
MAVVDVEGIAVGYAVTGSGSPLVLLHGGLCDRRVWREQVDLLADRYTVITWDAPGCGESEDPPATFTLADYATCLAGLLRRLDASPAHVVGHSWGGGLALQLAVDHPQTVRSLVVLGGYAGWRGSLPADEVERRLRKALDAAKALPGDFDPQSVPGLFSDLMTADRVRELTAVMSEVRPVGTRVMAMSFAEADLNDRLGEIAVPTLVLNGAADIRAPVAVAEQLHRAIPGSSLGMLPGLGHEAYLEAPEAVARAVADFVAGVP